MPSRRHPRNRHRPSWKDPHKHALAGHCKRGRWRTVSQHRFANHIQAVRGAGKWNRAHSRREYAGIREQPVYIGQQRRKQARESMRAALNFRTRKQNALRPDTCSNPRSDAGVAFSRSAGSANRYGFGFATGATYWLPSRTSDAPRCGSTGVAGPPEAIDTTDHCPSFGSEGDP